MRSLLGLPLVLTMAIHIVALPWLDTRHQAAHLEHRADLAQVTEREATPPHYSHWKETQAVVEVDCEICLSLNSPLRRHGPTSESAPSAITYLPLRAATEVRVLASALNAAPPMNKSPPSLA